MTIEDLYITLIGIGIPVAYHEFKSDAKNPPPKPPFMVYLETEPDYLIADNRNYLEIKKFDIELYTIKKDPMIEKRIEEKLGFLEIPYRKTGEARIQSENMFQTTYSISLF